MTPHTSGYTFATNPACTTNPQLDPRLALATFEIMLETHHEEAVPVHKASTMTLPRGMLTLRGGAAGGAAVPPSGSTKELSDQKLLAKALQWSHKEIHQQIIDIAGELLLQRRLRVTTVQQMLPSTWRFVAPPSTHSDIPKLPSFAQQRRAVQEFWNALQGEKPISIVVCDGKRACKEERKEGDVFHGSLGPNPSPTADDAKQRRAWAMIVSPPPSASRKDPFYCALTFD